MGHFFCLQICIVDMHFGYNYDNSSCNIARRFSRVLRSRPFYILHDPILTSILNVGGVWFLYTFDLFSMMHENKFLYVFIHFHIFFVGLSLYDIVHLYCPGFSANFLYLSVGYLVNSFSGTFYISEVYLCTSSGERLPHHKQNWVG